MGHLTGIAEHVKIVAKGRFDRLERESPFRHRERFPLATRFRREKVRVIREQLAQSTYDMDEHLDTIVESLFAAINDTKIVSADHISI
jgi:hypothetical protein